MGIRGLTLALKRYGVLSPLSGESVVIDGPALVHRILTECMLQRKPGSSFICQPSYSLLSHLVKGWLQELKNHNVKIRKIYFDGYLPPSKWEIRRERLFKQSQNMRDLFSLNPFGATRPPADDVFGSVKPSVVFAHFMGRSSVDNLPKPPFFVPAVIEALQNCQEWSPFIQVVSGEADVFCAHDVRQNGGIVFTTDSDLLIQDLGLNGRVSFFWDLIYDRSSGVPVLSTSTFSFHEINDQLGIKEIGGLPRVVYEQLNGRLWFKTAVRISKGNLANTLTSPGYLRFLKEYQMDECTLDDEVALNSVSALDPRISEIVVQTLLMTETGLVPDTQTKQAGRGPEVLSIFLPILIENQDMRSCWTTSTSVRETAYGILQSLPSHRSDKIIEYRTIDPSSGRSGRQIAIPGAAETVDACVQLVHTLKRLQEHLPDPNTQWLAFAMLQDVESSVVDGRTSLSATLLNQAASELAIRYEYSWDLIHYAAQVQASYYSLRIMKQIIDVVLALRQDSPEPFRELRESLASLPPIAEWPTVEAMPAILYTTTSKDIFSTVVNMLGIPSVDLDQRDAESTSLIKKNRMQKHDSSRSNGQGPGKRSPSINPFAILSQASQ